MYIDQLIFQVTTGIGILALSIIGLLLYVYIYDGLDRRVRGLEHNQASICTAVRIFHDSISMFYRHKAIKFTKFKRVNTYF